MNTPLNQFVARIPVAENIKAMNVHRGLAIFYGLAAVAFAVALFVGDKSIGTSVIPAFFLLIASLHGTIAFGAGRSAGWARACSIAVACLLLLAVPVGTAIGVYLLLNSRWPARQSA